MGSEATITVNLSAMKEFKSILASLKRRLVEYKKDGMRWEATARTLGYGRRKGQSEIKVAWFKETGAGYAGHPFPMFSIYRSGRVWWLTMIESKRKLPRHLPVESVAQGKVLAGKLVNMLLSARGENRHGN